MQENMEAVHKICRGKTTYASKFHLIIFSHLFFSEKTNVNNIKCLKFVKREKERGKQIMLQQDEG